MNLTFTLNKLFILFAVILWAVIFISGVFATQVPHELEWITAGLALFGIGFLV